MIEVKERFDHKEICVHNEECPYAVFSFVARTTFALYILRIPDSLFTNLSRQLAVLGVPISLIFKYHSPEIERGLGSKIQFDKIQGRNGSIGNVMVEKLRFFMLKFIISVVELNLRYEFG